MIISISGKPGAGKTTVANILAKKLHYKSYYMGGIRRELAKKHGMTLEEYNKFGESDPSTDKEVDEYQKKLGKTEDNFVIQGRTSFKFIPHSFKVYLDVDDAVAAERIWEDIQQNPEQRNEASTSLADVKKNFKKRMLSDKKRYLKYYGFDCYDTKHYDVVINTTDKTPEEVVGEIIRASTAANNLKRGEN
ncbi:MAG TPA: cytidylate kinase family protein [Candidatus Nanoarchaeia archaeon]|nr:cytidylate kinase family protein [Candidatus Nanoarchaeia archaeon]